MIVVGLSGYAGAGKDSVADILVRDYGFTKMAFADPLKRMVEDLDPIVGYDIYADCMCGGEDCQPEVEVIRVSDLYAMGYTDQTIKESHWGDEVRNLWQRFGTEVMRAEDEDFWVNQAAGVLGETTAERVVFTDVRFENEAEWIYWLREDHIRDPEIQSSVWRIARPDQHPDTVHVSEQMVGLLEEEVTILNDGTLEELGYPVAVAMNWLMTKDEVPGQTSINLDELARELGLMEEKK